MPVLTYLKGDVTQPILDRCVIAHVCNDIGVMGSGVAKAISDKWPDVRKGYLDWFNLNQKSNLEYDQKFQLGNIQICVVDFEGENPLKVVVNMIAQHSIITRGEKKPIRYDALRLCLYQVYTFCSQNNFTLHMPMIGSGLAGGDWNIIEQIIKNEMEVDTYIYQLKN